MRAPCSGGGRIRRGARNAWVLDGAACRAPRSLEGKRGGCGGGGWRDALSNDRMPCDARQFDYAFHLAACRELLRVAHEEVRIHPVCGADGRPYPELTRLRRELAAGGIGSEVRKVDYEFFAGSGTMLVLRREPTS